MNTADIEREKALRNRPAEESGSILNTQTQDPARFGEGENIESNYDPYAPKEPNFLQKVVGGVKNKVGNWVDNQRAKAIENSTPPEVTAQGGETLPKSDQLGLAANQTIQNAEIPNWKRMTFNDILFNPEYEPIRDSIASEAVRARAANLAAGLAGKQGGYTSAIDKYNNQQAQRYSDAVADRDTRALEAQLQADEAANKRDVGAELQRADTYLGRELDRWGLLYDTETKKQVLDQMVSDSQQFAKDVPNPEDRLLLTAYQQYLGGSATALDSIISVYGPEILEKIPSLLNKAGSLFGGDEEQTFPDIKIGNETFTAQELENLGSNRIDEMLQKLPLEEQDKVISQMEKSYGGKDVSKLREQYNGRVRANEVDKELIEQANQRAKEIEEQIAEIKANYTGKTRESNLQILKDDLDKNISAGLKQTDNIVMAKANIAHELSLAKLANEAVSVNKPIKKNIDDYVSNGNVNTKQANKGLEYLKSIVWKTFINNNTPSSTDFDISKDAIKETQGFKDVVDFLSNNSIKNYVSTGADRKDKLSTYKMAVDNFLNTFGGTEGDYGFATYSWDDINRL